MDQTFGVKTNSKTYIKDKQSPKNKVRIIALRGKTGKGECVNSFQDVQKIYLLAYGL